MADLTRSLPVILDLEGVYSKDPEDPGGETLFGISRPNNPSCPVWPILDRLKEEFASNQYIQDLRPNRAEVLRMWDKTLRENEELRVEVEKFYRAAYWEPLRGDRIASQRIADELMDIAINIRQGKRQAVTFLQRALNGLNKDGKLWPDIEVDGCMGPATLGAIERAVYQGRGDDVVKLVNCIQGVYYMENSKEYFLAGLLRRVKL